MRFFLLVALVLAPSCVHSKPANLKDIKDNSDLQTVYEQRQAALTNTFYRPEFIGNVVAEKFDTTLKFSDNTVFLGQVIGWDAWRLIAKETSGDPVSDATAVVNHILNNLVVPSTLPGSNVKNTGYFMRDNVTFTSVTVNGQTYSVQSDAQNGTDDEMSQDQIIHVLYGYNLLWQVLPTIQTDAAKQLLAMIQAHAHDIGTRLKAYNYIIIDPATGQPTKRGPDVRAFSWAVAQTISTITGKDLSTYLTSVYFTDKDVEGKLTLSAKQLEDLFKAAIDGLTVGVCDIKIGKNKQPICNRFTLRLINILYNAAGLAKPMWPYVFRMEKDGDYMGAIMARKTTGAPITEAYVNAAQQAVGADFSSSTGPGLWCMMNRWIYMPTSCPDTTVSTQYFYNGLDYLNYYLALRSGK